MTSNPGLSPQTAANEKSVQDGFAGLIARGNFLLQSLAFLSLTQFVLRVALATPFWRSGVRKWDGFLQLSDTAGYLFANELKLHLPGGPYDFPAPTAVAFLSGSAEIVFPVLLIVGLGTRFAAFGLLFMTAVIEITVPTGWPVHITWAAMALAIMARGPGKISLDHVIGNTLRSA